MNLRATYREIVLKEIDKLERKKIESRDRDEARRIEQTISALLNDLREYEIHQYWLRHGGSSLAINEIINKLLKDLFDTYE